MLHKIENDLHFNPKRNRNLITPCCNKLNKDGKFVNYKDFPEYYGFCHSCGEIKLPPTIYKDEFGTEFYWDTTTDSFKKNVLQNYQNVLHNCNTIIKVCNTKCNTIQKFIDFQLVNKLYNNPNENNLFEYLRLNYNNDVVDMAKKKYYIGTSKNSGTVFWTINFNQKVQKAKIVYYSKKGKRSNCFKVPYKNEDGYYSCLFGEHLLKDNTKPIILVESEKTAIVCSINLPNYTWLAYGGINGLTNQKAEVLKGKKIIIIPDISENAVSIMTNKVKYLNSIDVEVKIWDMTNGKSDQQLKEEGIYNCDLEDVFRQEF